MWTLKEINATNICAFQELHYSLLQGHTTLVFGNNMDNDSQGSNGSGKSAMLEVIAIGLTGEALRKIKMDEIINDAADEAIVNVALHNNITSEDLIIERIISRKNPQIIRIQLKKGDMIEDIVQSGITEYNRYILGRLGLSKDDILSHYILSKNKYTSFLACSDREKKEIINRFSNGDMVDESILALQEDIKPIEKDLSDATTKVAVINGKVDTLRQQIDLAYQEAAEKTNRKAEQIQNWKNSIAEKRSLIRNKHKEYAIVNKQIDEFDKCDQIFQDLEQGDKSLSDCFKAVCKAFSDAGITSQPNDRTNIINTHKNDIQNYTIQLKDLQDKIANQKEILDMAQGKLNDGEVQYKQFLGGFDNDCNAIKAEMNDVAAEITDIEANIATFTADNQRLSKEIAAIEQKLAGVIECPKCHYEFVLTDKNFDTKKERKALEKCKELQTQSVGKIENGRKAVTNLMEDGKQLRVKFNQLLDSKTQWSSKIADLRTYCDNCSVKLSSLNKRQSDIKEQINILNKDIDNARTGLFDETYDILDKAIKDKEFVLDTIEREINNAEGAIISYEESIAAIEKDTQADIISSLKNSKAIYEQDLIKAIDKQETIQNRLNTCKSQEVLFNEFKTHLANTKIQALNHITNEFLIAIGSDIRIALSGFTVLKNGKIRDKISVSLMRDGIDCGSFDKFSAGERARVELAVILAMNKLTNASCDAEKGLNLLILDEILEAVDEQGLNNIFNALNQLQITSLVVSHGNVAEGYPYKTVVNKLNGISFINEQH